MSPQEAICRIRVIKSASDKEQIQDISNEFQNHTGLPSDIPRATRLQWAESITEKFLDRQNLDTTYGIRDWDLVLSLDGSVENRADNTLPASPSTRAYSARYRIPEVIVERISSDEEILARKQFFALGSLLYEIFTGTKIFSSEKGEEDIQARFVEGKLPEDIWGLSCAVRILACWCPGFAKDLLAAHRMDESLGSKVAGYIKKHPVLFGFQVVGGIASLASIVALPILGAVGFGAAGPIAGSAAAGWQAGIGLVEAGSIFAWCQSAAMGGAAIGGILATGLTGAGVAVGATLTGALDSVDTPAIDMKEKFLAAWDRDIGRT